MKLAEKFGLPVVTLIDTPGAYPGIGAEERGQAESIARNLLEMSRLRTPIVTIVTGEGGSGGALGIGVADRVAMMEFAWYSVISPEACSAILFKGNEEAAELAESLRLTSKDLRQFGVVDAVIPEPLGGAHRDPHTVAHNLEQYVSKTLRDLKRFKLENLLERRYEKFRNLGVVADSARRHAGKAAG
jgi:acetyl-CoA carboxylase carboxyl transferase subunit alpha